MTPIRKNYTTGKKTALESVLTENEKKQLTDLAPPRVFLARKAAIKNVKNVMKQCFYLKNQYLPDNEEQRTFIEDIPSQEDILSFEVITDYIETFSKSIKEVENMSLKKKALLGNWISQQRKYSYAIKIGCTVTVG